MDQLRRQEQAMYAQNIQHAHVSAMAQARMERELINQPSTNPITGMPGLPPRAPVRSQQVRGGASIIQDPAFMDGGASDIQMRNNKRAIKDSKMQQIAKFDSQFSKPMADRTPQILDALYFRNQRNDSGIQRTNSVNLANTGHRVMGSYEQSPGNGEPRVGKRMLQAPIGSTSNLLYGNYGSDPESQLERNFKPYSKSVNRS